MKNKYFLLIAISVLFSVVFVNLYTASVRREVETTALKVCKYYAEIRKEESDSTVFDLYQSCVDDLKTK